MNSAVLPQEVDVEQETEMDKPTIAEVAQTVAVLERHVDNYIKFFVAVVLAVCGWNGWISKQVIDMKGSLGEVQKAQADEPFKIVASILKNNQPASLEEEAGNLTAVSSYLRSAKVMRAKPDRQLMINVGNEIVKAQDTYSDLPVVWKASSSFINYKSKALLATSSIPSSLRADECKESISPTLHSFVFDKCEVDLDDLVEHIRDNKINGVEAAFTFVNCIVSYRGGPIPAKRLVFVDSIFQFQVDKVPDPSGAIAMRQLALSTSADSDVTL